MSVGNGNQNTTLQVSSMLWFGSLVFSVGAALNSLLAMAWNETRSYVLKIPFSQDPSQYRINQRLPWRQTPLLGDNVD